MMNITMKRTRLRSMIREGVSNRTPMLLIKRIGVKVNETKVETMVIITARVIMSEMGITTVKKKSIMVTIVTEMIGMVLMFYLKIVKLLLGMVGVVWREFRI